jgi:hypothetical protein
LQRVYGKCSDTWDGVALMRASIRSTGKPAPSIRPLGQKGLGSHLMTMNRRMIAGQLRIPGSGNLISITLLFLVWGLLDQASAHTTQHQIQRLKITILSTMLVGDTTGIGEWGFAALVDVDGHRMLVDTLTRIP